MNKVNVNSWKKNRASYPLSLKMKKIRRLVEAMEEEKGFYRGEKASMETTAFADLADTENICLYIEELNSKLSNKTPYIDRANKENK